MSVTGSVTGLTDAGPDLTGLCVSGVCARGGGASLPSADSGVSGAAARLRSADRDERRKLRRWKGDQGEPTSDQASNRLMVLFPVIKQGSNRLMVLFPVIKQGSNRLMVLFPVFQTREQLLTEISRYETRVADLESALKQQGLVKHAHTHTYAPTHTHTPHTHTYADRWRDNRGEE